MTYVLRGTVGCEGTEGPNVQKGMILHDRLGKRSSNHFIRKDCAPLDWSVRLLVASLQSGAWRCRDMPLVSWEPLACVRSNGDTIPPGIHMGFTTSFAVVRRVRRQGGVSRSGNYNGRFAQCELVQWLRERRQVRRARREESQVSSTGWRCAAGC